MSAQVNLKKIYKQYFQGEEMFYALEGIDLSIEKGEFLSICGPSGSGKTTLLNIIGGLDNPSSGEVWVTGECLSQMSRGQQAEFRLYKIGFIFQSYNLIPVLSARENVEFVMQLQGVSTKEKKDRAMVILSEVGLSGLENRRPAQLSGGQQQRVAVARAIVSNPSIVLADEPTANLDSVTAVRLLDLMRQLNQEKQITFIFSTHDKQVMSFAKRLIELRDGKVISDKPN